MKSTRSYSIAYPRYISSHLTNVHAKIDYQAPSNELDSPRILKFPSGGRGVSFNFNFTSSSTPDVFRDHGASNADPDIRGSPIRWIFHFSFATLIDVLSRQSLPRTIHCREKRSTVEFRCLECFIIRDS